MFRHISARAVFVPALVLGSVLGISGCDSLRHGVRSEKSESGADHAEAVPSGGNQVLDVRSSSKQPFFRPSRLPGGLSDESREIERDLGIH